MLAAPATVAMLLPLDIAAVAVVALFLWTLMPLRAMYSLSKWPRQPAAALPLLLLANSGPVLAELDIPPVVVVAGPAVVAAVVEEAPTFGSRKLLTLFLHSSMLNILKRTEPSHPLREDV